MPRQQKAWSMVTSGTRCSRTSGARKRVRVHMHGLWPPASAHPLQPIGLRAPAFEFCVTSRPQLAGTARPACPPGRPPALPRPRPPGKALWSPSRLASEAADAPLVVVDERVLVDGAAAIFVQRTELVPELRQEIAVHFAQLQQLDLHELRLIEVVTVLAVDVLDKLDLRGLELEVHLLLEDLVVVPVDDDVGEGPQGCPVEGHPKERIEGREEDVPSARHLRDTLQAGSAQRADCEVEALDETPLLDSQAIDHAQGDPNGEGSPGDDERGVILEVCLHLLEGPPLLGPDALQVVDRQPAALQLLGRVGLLDQLVARPLSIGVRHLDVPVHLQLHPGVIALDQLEDVPVEVRVLAHHAA
mmetsp:Transcript_142141/g.442041  ORF Transcript_142141/g.442041 Transcript_142141/m.442041 type:complete len:359 (+) Transcript_142141:96-1172(+)